MIKKPNDMSIDDKRMMERRKYDLTIRILPNIKDRIDPKTKGISNILPVVT
jgi:hypothetical protein